MGEKNIKIRVVSSREEIFTLNPNERIVHLAFRPSNKDVLGLVDTCPKLEVLQLSQSYRRSVSKSIQTFLDMRRIQLVEGDVWGHRKDISEYFVIKPSVFEKIKEMKLEGKMAEEIKVKVSRESKLSPQMVAYVMDKDNPD
ncbi:MAG: hypothetical protein QG646_648 [Euryarchaeota archaeon]|nr:hypothetical protein [Euryarchaeota archaeon]